ncbi:MAG: lipid-A-disaccharide synthase [Alphaproteobacteria bacterium]|nr:lipid-A-disaccharide synthase [Alphaproteobacteria bacterium]MBU1513787.1 lipid-A-disaccharide synthase [Alphaproteobacteria bacterium]MBU2094568.1 lipid-A-disaccharide synthase [Alphaproteobacteria bacterium]MBU2149673.1 lipid-A-disaccharide synthase [Alphaproteobacteria bacterium]MBU2309108.1 lipid-A-disaccharide synthase [Alphaproteobacteria bacterium]
MTRRPLTVMLVAAEASGDDRGAGLARALKRRLGDGVRFVGVGGARMRAEGVDSPFDISDLSIFGLLEGLLAYRKVVRRADETAALAARETPDVAVLIDSWGFTLRVAHRLRRQAPTLPLVKYVAPQVWASRPGRARTAAKWFDLLLTIHSFDAPAFEREGLKTTLVGDATLAIDFASADPARLRREIGAGPDDPILLVLPGSRPSEIERVLPAFEDAVRRLKAERPELHVVVPAAPTVAELVKARVAGWPHKAHVVEGDTAKRDAMAAATVALACSGTVTTELAVAGTPMVIGYRLAPVTYAILKRLIRTKYVTLFNIAAQDFVAPELIQDACNGEALAREVRRRLDDAALRQRQVERQTAALLKMGRGGPDPNEAAAIAVLELLSKRA